MCPPLSVVSDAHTFNNYRQAWKTSLPFIFGWSMTQTMSKHRNKTLNSDTKSILNAYVSLFFWGGGFLRFANFCSPGELLVYRLTAQRSSHNVSLINNSFKSCFSLTCQAQNKGRKLPDRSSPPPLRPAAPVRLLQMETRAKIIRIKPEKGACSTEISPWLSLPRKIKWKS